MSRYRAAWVTIAGSIVTPRAIAYAAPRANRDFATTIRSTLPIHEYASIMLFPAVVRVVAMGAPGSVVEVERWHAGALGQVEAITGLDLTRGLEVVPLLERAGIVSVVAEDHPLSDGRCSVESYLRTVSQSGRRGRGAPGGWMYTDGNGLWSISALERLRLF